MALIVGLFSIIVDAYIFFDLKRNFRSRRWPYVLYAVLSAACWVFLAVCLLLPRRNVETSIEFQMWGLYAYLTVYVAKFIFCIFSLIGSIPRLWKGRPVRLGLYVGLPVALIAFFMMWWGVAVTRHKIEVVDVDVYSDRLPPAFEGYRIVQISDLHTGTWGDDTSFIDNLVDSINSLHPDIVLFTGDIVNRETRELAPFLKSLSKIKAPDGVYSVLGNHDYGDYVSWQSPQEKQDNLRLMKNWQRQIGWKMLNNERDRIIRDGDTIQLLGVENWGEPPFHQYGHLTDTYPIARDSVYHLLDNRYKILLTHNPEHWRREVTQVSNVDLTLSGHTHAMQLEIRLGDFRWSPSAFKYEQWGGLYQATSPDGRPMQIYVNIGAGEVGMPFRIGATPEITLITLKRGIPQKD